MPETKNQPLIKTLSAGDAWGGLSASALVLPQAMAFGITLWTPYFNDPAAAALSGLVAAACLCIASGAFMGTRGLVSAPTGPTLVLLSGVLASLAATGLSGAALMTATLVTVALAGVFQFMIGLLKMGHLIKFIPYPVVSGFMTGSAILMILSQTRVVMGGESDLTMHQGAWIPLATAGITMAAMVWLPRLIQKVPGTALGLLAGTLSFHAFSLFTGSILPAGWVVGVLPDVSAMQFGIDSAALGSLPWVIVLPSALALAVLASLDTLLTGVVADVATGARHDARRELMGQGAGHLLASVSGGMAGAGTTGATLVAITSGGRQWVGLLTGIAFLLLILFIGPAASLLPISVFAGIILHVAIFGMLDKDIPLWLQTPQARLDGLIALSVTAVTVFYDLMAAVALGVLLAVIEFIRTQVQNSVIQRRWDLGERTSLRRRIGCACELMKKKPDSIVGYELKGTLFFGTTDHLFDSIATDLKRARAVILDLRRVTQVDLTAIRLIEHMSGMMAEHGAELILTNVPKSMGLVKRKGHRHERVIPYHSHVRIRTFSDADHALEYAEDQLLESLGEAQDEDQELELTESELFRDFNDKEMALIAPYLKSIRMKTGTNVFHEGDAGDALYILLKGQVEILLPYSSRKKIRLAKFGPGTIFGEVAFLEPGKRTAEAAVVLDGRCMQLSHAAMQELCSKHPDIGIRILVRLGHRLSQNLRMADIALRQFAL
ncbi:MAG: SulP family inorganic anion transporter [Mariprofundaceae bacterium]|nr:SulP family inorganic anion transporter [Mariprofundaceae bacterium]